MLIRKSTFFVSVLLVGLVGRSGYGQELLTQLNQDINQGKFGRVNSLLIWHDGSLLMEEYYNGYHARRLHNVYSTTKSVTSALVGIAVQNEFIDGVDTSMLDFFPDYIPANLDAHKRAITLDDMLQMRAGFLWDELSIPYGNPGNSLFELNRSGRDVIEYVLDVEMSAAPGEQFAYNSGVSHLLSRVISESVGKNPHEFAKETLFADLEINFTNWEAANRGRDINTSHGLRMRPSDMLKIGQLYLNEGYWPALDKQVISSEWVHKSTWRYSEGIPSDTVPSSLGYGYQWWMFDDEAPQVSNLEVNDVYFSWGFGGQFIFVSPHSDLVVVSTGENFGDSDRFFAALTDYVFPAVVPEPTSLFLLLAGLLGLSVLRTRQIEA